MPHLEIERKRIDTPGPSVRPATLRASSMGRHAARAVGTLTIFARFARATYAKDSAGRVVCLVPATGEDGPIHARIDGIYPTFGTSFDLIPGPIWTAPALPPATSAALARGLAHARAARPTPDPHPTRAAYAEGLAALARWRAGDAPVAACGALIGLGAGLTPSGDDALGGAAIALRVFGAVRAADELAEFLRAAVPGRTSDIAAAFLEAACEGEGTAGFHAALGALSRGDDDFAPLAAMGHSSGWDAMDGACAVLAVSARR